MGTNGSKIPEKETYKIGEVAALAEVEPYVLRYWETEFPSLQPPKSEHGQRVYRRQDVETVFAIKRLLYEQGFTIAGARKQLEATSPATPAMIEPPAVPTSVAAGAPVAAFDSPKPHPSRERLRAVRDELVALLTLLSRR
jgi:DNA-binding transcriptional MerR regulator